MMRMTVFVFAILLLANMTLLASSDLCAGEVSDAADGDRLGGGDLCAGAEGGEPERGGGRVERHDVDGEYGERQPG